MLRSVIREEKKREKKASRYKENLLCKKKRYEGISLKGWWVRSDRSSILIGGVCKLFP